MTFLKNSMYSALAFSLALMPTLAHAQWNVGITNAQNSQLPESTIYDLIETAMNYLLAVLGFFGIIAFVIAGILYLTAAGDEKKAEKAKNAMTYAIMGIIVALIGFIIIQAVNTFLDGGSQF
jgi:Type IV secretion system pilin